MSNWYQYEKRRFVENQNSLFDEPFLDDDDISEIESWVNFNWDGSEYHCMAHMFGVANTALELAHMMDLDDTYKKIITMAGLFHDAGRRAIDDAENVKVASELFEEFNLMHQLDYGFFDYTLRRMLVHDAIKATQYPPPGKITSRHGMILRDADFAATLTPAPVVKEIRQALADEMGVVQTDYSFVVGQGALLPATVKYYKKFGLDIEMIKE